jgi:nucleoside-diphosphate-sugar epimerase
LVRFGNLVGPLAHPVLYPRHLFVRLYLNIFRGEPAISRFD